MSINDFSGASPGEKRTPRKRRIGLGVLISAVLTAILIAAGNWAFWSWLNRPAASPSWEGKIGGFAFNGFQRDQSPLPEEASYPNEQELASDIKLLSGYTDRLRTYSAIDAAAVPALAREHGMRVTAGAWLSSDKEQNNLEIKALLQLLRDNPNIDRAMVGNETLLRGDLKPAELMRYIDIVRRRSKVPVSTAESWDVWLHHKDAQELARHVEFITVHLLPYWEGVPREGAVTHVMRRYEEMRRAFPKKKIVIGEVGWPSGGSRVRLKNPAKLDDPAVFSTASVADEAQFIREFLPIAKKRGLDYYLMEAFDQPWKRSNEGRTGAYWGIFNADREPKFSLEGPVVPDAGWPLKAIVASALALFPIMAFCIAFARFRLMGRLFFGVVIQAAVALIIWLVTLPFEFYLNTLDWAMLVVLLPALAAMLMILLANAFEFTEIVWQRHWQRHFRPERPSLDAQEPFISIHLPCHNEPPEMVIQTLASMARLDYRNYEVLVIDNNTKSEDVWKPVERHVARLNEHERESNPAAAPRFRFFHLDNWPGFKAGALNFALGETDARAAIVGVVDADYVVHHEWLKVTVGHFEAPHVAVVQCPQAHRDWQHNAFQRMTNWEYDGFFRIGMHHRNERDAIIQHGTMTLVRKVALEASGGWSEWCICEDAELGLKLMNAGWETRYIDEVLGRGLTPSSFSGYKSQRFRWAFGAMQILKRRWNWLWGRQDKMREGHATPKPRGLSGGQRFHFLTGWFSWFADALHLFFTLASLAWTAGMLLSPENFSLPLDLFVIPVLAFFVLKAWFGPSLYRVRVPCGWRDVIGASIASMALSHAIARGILAGLIQKRGTFVVTPKSWQTGKKKGWFAWVGAVREEGLMAFAIAAGMAGVLMRMPIQYESVLWIGILVTQAIPYLSSVTCALISAYAPRRAERVPDSEIPVGVHAGDPLPRAQQGALQANA